VPASDADAIGVSVLGAVLARRVADGITQGLSAAGIPASGDAGSSLDVGALPEAIQDIVRSAYGDATGHIFLISAAIAVLGLIAAIFLRPSTLRTSLDLPGRREAGRREAGRREAGRREAGRREAGRREAGRREPGQQGPGRREPGQQGPGRQGPGR
jgi:hypothetical protein